jgi:hypothetical protein
VGKLKVAKSKDLSYEQERYYTLDMDFIHSIIARLKHNEASSSDDEIRKAFESYTLMILDLSLSTPVELETGTIIHKPAEGAPVKVTDMLLTRVRRFQRTTMFKVHRV